MKKILLASLFVAMGCIAKGQTLNESFETWPPQGWELGSEKGKGAWEQTDCKQENGPGSAKDGEHAAFVDYANLPFVRHYIVTPAFDVSNLKNPELSFQWFHQWVERDNSHLEIYAGYEENGEIVFKLISKLTTDATTSATEWMTYSRVLSRDVKQIKILGDKSNYVTKAPIYIDCLKIQEGPQVAPPIELGYHLLPGTDGKVKLTWKPINDEKMWNVTVSETFIDPATSAGDFSQKGIENTPEAVFDGLEVGKRYHWYVQTTDGNNVSTWEEGTFQVDPAPLAVPFVIDFEVNDGNFIFIQDEQVNTWNWGSAANTGEGGKCMYVSQDNGESYTYTNAADVRSHCYREIVFPEDMPNGCTLSFDFQGVGDKLNHCMKIFLISDLSVYPVAGKFLQPSGDIVKQLGTYSLVSEWSHFEVEIPTWYAGKNIRMAISWTNNYYAPASNPPAAIDNIKIEKANCAIPKNIAVTDATTESVTLDWEVGPSAVKWEVEYGAHNFEPGTGTVVLVEQQPPFTVTGLDECRHYDFLVRAYCGETHVSDYSKRAHVDTKCLDKTAPYSCNFDDLEQLVQYPAGWSYTTKSQNYKPYVLASSYWGHSQPNCMGMNDPTGKSQVTLVSPLFSDLKDKNNRISFYARIEPQQHLIIGVMSDITNPDTFTELKVLNGIDYPEYDPVSGVPGPAMRRHIVYLNTDEIKEDHKYIAFRSGSIMAQMISIDDFVYEKLPSCIEPVDLHPLDVSDESARMTWKAQGGEQKWEIVWGKNFYVPDENAEGLVVTEPVALLENLDSDTFYTCYVRALCSDNDKGPWSESYYFRTCVGEIVLPWMENFDYMYTIGLAPLCWSVKDYHSLWVLNKEGYNSYPHCVNYPQTDKPLEDWLFTPPIYLEAGVSYFYSFWAMSGAEESDNMLTVHFGQQPEQQAMGETLTTMNNLTDRYKIVKTYFTPEESGYYYGGINYKGTASQGLFIDDIMVEQRNNPNAIDKVEKAGPVLYPTLAKESFRIEFEGADAHVAIYSSEGALAKNILHYQSSESISVVGLPDGVYVVQVSIGDHISFLKMVINK